MDGRQTVAVLSYVGRFDMATQGRPRPYPAVYRPLRATATISHCMGSRRYTRILGTSSLSTARRYGSPPGRRTNTLREIWSLLIAHRSQRAKWAIREKKPGMTLAEFCDDRFEPWAKSTFGKSSPKTWLDFYRVGLRAIRNCRSLAGLRLDEITSERAAEFAAYRQSQGLQVSTVNSSLRVLRRMVRLAVEWGELHSEPTIKRLPGERHREHVVSYDEESRYLGAGSELLAAISTVLIDTGLRPEECYRLRWESITWASQYPWPS
jgi:integrase